MTRDTELLTADQAAAVLGISPSTLRAYASRGQAPAGRRIGGARRWTWAEIEHHRDNPPSADPARRGGRPPGVRETKPRAPRAAAHRAADIAARLAAGDEVTVGQLMGEYGVTERTAQRLLKRARDLDAG
jgi:predicted DNA-binding transcriptional regulator AlpA